LPNRFQLIQENKTKERPQTGKQNGSKDLQNIESQNAVHATNFQTHDFKLPNKSNFIQTLNSIQHSEGLSNFNVE
jgi:hypothetical protein